MLKKYKYIISLLVLLLLLAGFYFWFSNKTVAYEFNGNVTAVSSNLLKVKGTFVSTEDMKEIEVMIDNKTKITREGFTIPSSEELKKTSGRFNVEELPKEVSNVDLQTLGADFERRVVGLNLKGMGNFKKNKFYADEIKYRVPLN